MGKNILKFILSYYNFVYLCDDYYYYYYYYYYDNDSSSSNNNNNLSIWGLTHSPWDFQPISIVTTCGHRINKVPGFNWPPLSAKPDSYIRKSASCSMCRQQKYEQRSAVVLARLLVHMCSTHTHTHARKLQRAWTVDCYSMAKNLISEHILWYTT